MLDAGQEGGTRDSKKYNHMINIICKSEQLN